MGLVHGDIGLEAQTLKVGDFLYEVAVPPKDLIKLRIADELVRDPSEINEEEDDNDNDKDDDVDLDLDNLESILYKGIKGLQVSEDSYKDHPNEVPTVQGNSVPLLISRGEDWKNRTVKSLSYGPTYVKPRKVVERAVHIFQSSFSRKSYNGH
ncbi:MAG: hypothetical protein Q9219_002631, partial [cf. Caloplaca sp. 3 TL-2023]